MLKKNLSGLRLALALVIALSGISGCSAGKTTSSGSSSQANANGFDVSIGNGDNAEGASSGTSGGAAAASGGQGGSSKSDEYTPLKLGQTVANNKDKSKFPGRATNLNGRTITVQYWNSYLKGGQGTEISKRAQILNENIEKTLNCKLQFVSMTDDNIRTSVAAGSPAVDVWWTQTTNEFFNAYTAGLLQPLDSLKVIDFSDRSRYTAGNDIPVINGVHYGIAPNAYGTIRLVYDNVMFVNFDVLSKANYTADQLYNLQNSGQWTWANFDKVCGALSKVSGVYPCTEFINDTKTDLYTYQMLVNSNGADWISRNNTSVTFNGGSNAARAALTQYAQWFTKGYIQKKNYWESKSDFLSGKVAFMPTTLTYLTVEAGDQIAKMNVGIMYPPKGPNASNYDVDATDYSFACIPKGVSKPNEVATVLDLINTPLFSDAEEKANMNIEAMSYFKVKGAVNTLVGLFNRGDPVITWSCLGSGAGISSTDKKDGWYDLVGQVATGNKTVEQAVQSAGNYNTLLQNIMKKR